MSRRVKTEIQNRGVPTPISVAPTASDEGLISAILQVVGMEYGTYSVNRRCYNGLNQN